METKTIQKFRWFWAWQDEVEEAWLQQMSQQGWHLISMALPGFYTFTTGEPQDTVYRLDYRFGSKRKDKEAYLQLFRDAGWEYVGEMSNWQYFRKHVQEGETLEIFTDAESKIEKYRRLLGLMVVFLPILIILRPKNSDPIQIGVFIINIIFILLMIIYAYAILKLMQRIKQLKRQ